MDYISSKEASYKWNIPEDKLAILCCEQKIQGASLRENMWIIPANTEKPDLKILNFSDGIFYKVKPFLK